MFRFGAKREREKQRQEREHVRELEKQAKQEPELASLRNLRVDLESLDRHDASVREMYEREREGRRVLYPGEIPTGGVQKPRAPEINPGPAPRPELPEPQEVDLHEPVEQRMSIKAAALVERAIERSTNGVPPGSDLEASALAYMDQERRDAKLEEESGGLVCVYDPGPIANGRQKIYARRSPRKRQRPFVGARSLGKLGLGRLEEEPQRLDRWERPPSDEFYNRVPSEKEEIARLAAQEAARVVREES